VPIDILMPSAGTDMTEGGIARWAKQPGDAVRKGEVLLDIETDKALVEVKALHDGVLARILAADGALGVKVGSVIAILALPGEDLQAAAVAPRAAAIAAPPAASAVATAAARVAASPLARRVAAAMQVDLAGVHGSGPRGRVVKVDVERAAEAGAAAPAIAAAEPAGWEDLPHSAVRRVIAQRLSEAKRTIPHFYLAIDCDVDALLALRGELAAQAQFKPSINDLLVKAVALALKAVPAVNASWGEEAVRRHRSVDVSVAVATPGGLMTPIVRDADTKSLGAISAEIGALADRARQGRLKPQEFQGGGFTISNLGMHGIREFYAIVNPPQACILAVGACEQRAVVRAGALAIATQMTCTLSADHRVVDGALGAEFLGALRGLVEAPLALLA
jgi:pyruvate dehydrogenase E2 component (dihydrolipoamide acetyltransferase)